MITRNFIKMLDGVPQGHPISEENMRYAFPDVDLENLPDSFREFKRIFPRQMGPFEVNIGSSYEIDGAFVKDVWHFRDMTDEERERRINKLRQEISFNISNKKITAINQLLNAENDTTKAVWQSFLNSCENFDFDTVDWNNPRIPMLPIFDAEGNHISKRTREFLYVEGSQPDVIR